MDPTYLGLPAGAIIKNIQPATPQELGQLGPGAMPTFDVNNINDLKDFDLKHFSSDEAFKHFTSFVNSQNWDELDQFKPEKFSNEAGQRNALHSKMKALVKARRSASKNIGHAAVAQALNSSTGSNPNLQISHSVPGTSREYALDQFKALYSDGKFNAKAIENLSDKELSQFVKSHQQVLEQYSDKDLPAVAARTGKSDALGEGDLKGAAPAAATTTPTAATPTIQQIVAALMGANPPVPPAAAPAPAATAPAAEKPAVTTPAEKQPVVTPAPAVAAAATPGKFDIT